MSPIPILERCVSHVYFLIVGQLFIFPYLDLGVLISTCLDPDWESGSADPKLNPDSKNCYSGIFLVPLALLVHCQYKNNIFLY
jgi:hypothetical protein